MFLLTGYFCDSAAAVPLPPETGLKQPARVCLLQMTSASFNGDEFCNEEYWVILSACCCPAKTDGVAAGLDLPTRQERGPARIEYV